VFYFNYLRPKKANKKRTYPRGVGRYPFFGTFFLPAEAGIELYVLIVRAEKVMICKAAFSCQLPALSLGFGRVKVVRS
jgi:hypothetical protein